MFFLVKYPVHKALDHELRYWILNFFRLLEYDVQVLDTWLAYAPVKNNPEDAAKVSFHSSS